MPRVIIKPVDPWWRVNIKEIIRSKDLIWFLIRRDFISEYKQTIIGPAWFMLQPLGATIIFTVIFGKVAKLGTEGIPPLIFYNSGLILWAFFQNCLNGTSGSLRKNAGLYQKVYFPRLISPLVEIVNGFWKYLLNFMIFLGFLFYYIVFTEVNLTPNLAILLTPLILINTALLGSGTGLLLSSLTYK